MILMRREGREEGKEGRGGREGDLRLRVKGKIKKGKDK
jgi:hypothetical protein